MLFVSSEIIYYVMPVVVIVKKFFVGLAMF